jgi:hypothetical protein
VIKKLPKLVGFFHGIDVATQGDFFANVVHALFEKPVLHHGDKVEDQVWNPVIVSIMRLAKRDPNKMIDLQIKQFNKYPPMLCKIDSSREDFLTFALQRKYGESKIIGVKFLNSGGQSNTKFMLKQTGYSYLNAGYQWPNDEMLDEISTPRNAKLFRILKREMMYELAEYTKSGRITFNHPIGKHNDLVHGWELSLSAVMDFQKKNLGYEKRAINSPEYDTILNEIYKDYPKPEDDEEDPVLYRRRTNPLDAPWRMPP